MRDIWQRIEPPIILSVPEDNWIPTAIVGFVGTVIGAAVTIIYSHFQNKAAQKSADASAALKLCMQLYLIVNSMNSYIKYIETELENANNNNDLLSLEKNGVKFFAWWPVIHPTVHSHRAPLNFDQGDMSVLVKNGLNKYIDDIYECFERYNSFLSNLEHYNKLRENIIDFESIEDHKILSSGFTESFVKKNKSAEFEIKSSALERHIKSTYKYLISDSEKTYNVITEISSKFRKIFGKKFSVELIRKDKSIPSTN